MPDALGLPAARYAHAVLVEQPTRWLHTSGVVANDREGRTPDGVAAQARLIWANIDTLLAEVGMTSAHVVSVTTYVVATAMGEGLAQAMAARDDFLGGRRVASTLLTVPALAQPQWLVEIAVVAAA